MFALGQSCIEQIFTQSNIEQPMHFLHHFPTFSSLVATSWKTSWKTWLVSDNKTKMQRLEILKMIGALFCIQFNRKFHLFTKYTF